MSLRSEPNLSKGIRVAQAGYLFAAFFSSLLHSETFWVGTSCAAALVHPDKKTFAELMAQGRASHVAGAGTF